jgi:hypothetical protein
MYNILNNVVTALNNEFPRYTKGYINEVLGANSLNIERTYAVLQDYNKNSAFNFSEADDEIILHMKGTGDYANLVKVKGADKVQEREDFLLA